MNQKLVQSLFLTEVHLYKIFLISTLILIAKPSLAYTITKPTSSCGLLDVTSLQELE